MNFITINLPENPTDDQLRKAREIFALMRSMSNATDPKRGDTDGTAEVDATVFTGPAIPPPPAAEGGFQATVRPPGNGDTAPLYDATGLVWDARIHSSTKGTNNDGSWKKRRGVQDAEVTRIEAELRAAYTPAAAPTTPPPPPADAAVPPPPPPPAAPVTPPVVASGNPFVVLLQKISGLINANKLTQKQVVEICVSVGVEALPLLARRPDLIGTVDTLIDAATAG